VRGDRTSKYGARRTPHSLRTACGNAKGLYKVRFRWRLAVIARGDEFLHAAVSHLALGDNQAALVAASEACWRAPKLASAHYAYGQAFAALGEAARAEQAFAAAIHLNPRWADAWVNYGLVRYRQGAIEDAKTAMRQALAARCERNLLCGQFRFERRPARARRRERRAERTRQRQPGRPS
jgi:Flp pilus assembly protein TadD